LQHCIKFICKLRLGMGRAIFISYRRDDTEGEAGRLFDDLVRSFDEDSVFMDVSDIRPGVDFRKEIDANVASCGVLLAVIGPNWITMTGATGGRRLDDPNDFVRLEIASALARDIAVIPVLVHDARMPRPEDLPENLRDLAYRNSVEITHADALRGPGRPDGYQARARHGCRAVAAADSPRGDAGLGPALECSACAGDRRRRDSGRGRHRVFDLPAAAACAGRKEACCK
jgi:hypothetical protein